MLTSPQKVNFVFPVTVHLPFEIFHLDKYALYFKTNGIVFDITCIKNRKQLQLGYAIFDPLFKCHLKVS